MIVRDVTSKVELHWSELDADLFIPSLLAGVFDDQAWIAAKLGAAGGKSRSEATIHAARANDNLGGWPHKKVSD